MKIPNKKFLKNLEITKVIKIKNDKSYIEKLENEGLLYLLIIMEAIKQNIEPKKIQGITI